MAPPIRVDPLAAAATWSRWLAFVTLLLAGGLAALTPSTAAPIAMAVAVIGFLAGVPHGAVDHLMTRRLSGRRSMALVIAVYAGLACAVWALSRWTVPVALLALVVLSAIHFGLGELEVSRLLTGWRPGPITATAIAIAGCGALIVPLARSGEQFRTVAATISPGLAQLIGYRPVQAGLAVLWLTAAAVAITAAVRARHLSLAADLTLIGAVGLLVPPLVAFAIWFGGWHGLRHMARLLTVDPACAQQIAAGRPRAAVARLARQAAWPSAAVLTVVAALVWFATREITSAAVVAEVLSVLLALTVPHMAVVFWLDRAAGRSAQPGR